MKRKKEKQVYKFGKKMVKWNLKVWKMWKRKEKERLQPNLLVEVILTHIHVIVIIIREVTRKVVREVVREVVQEVVQEIITAITGREVIQEATQEAVIVTIDQ